jgi:hypothetical protein
MLSNKYFFIWDGNHHLLAWNDHIDMVHKGDFEWYYRMRSIVLDSKNGITDCLTAMHDINKATENSHMKSNLVHILHRMQKIGSLPAREFKSLLTLEDFEQALAHAESTSEKKP